jgi:NAD(P)H-dependent FMN reductase
VTALAAQEPVRLLLVCGSLRAGSTNAAVLKTVQAVAPGGVETASYDAWINASGTAAPTGGADAHESLRKVLGYVGAEIVEDACSAIPVARRLVDADGLIRDDEIRTGLARVLDALAGHLRRAGS